MKWQFRDIAAPRASSCDTVRASSVKSFLLLTKKTYFSDPENCNSLMCKPQKGKRNTHTNAHASIHVHTYTRTHTQMHVHTDTYTRTYARTHTLLSSCFYTFINSFHSVAIYRLFLKLIYCISLGHMLL